MIYFEVEQPDEWVSLELNESCIKDAPLPYQMAYYQFKDIPAVIVVKSYDNGGVDISTEKYEGVHEDDIPVLSAQMSLLLLPGHQTAGEYKWFGKIVSASYIGYDDDTIAYIVDVFGAGTNVDKMRSIVCVSRHSGDYTCSYDASQDSFYPVGTVISDTLKETIKEYWNTTFPGWVKEHTKNED